MKVNINRAKKSESIEDKIFNKVQFMLDNGECAHCGQIGGVDAYHINHNPSDCRLENLFLLCDKCGKKHKNKERE